MTQDILWEGKVAGENEINSAIKAAKNALPNWSYLALSEREKILNNYAAILKQKKDYLAEFISKESGKPLWESHSEVSAMIGKIQISIDAQNARCPLITISLPPGKSITRHKPLGVAAIFGPFNFPGHLPNGHIVPALLAGNTIVFKPSEHTPKVGELMVRLWEEAGLPDGVLNLIQGGPSTGKLLSRHPEIDALFFTGSWKTGRLLAEHFGRHPEKLLALEMGGNNPLVIGSITNLTAAAYLIIQSSFLTAGQRCTSARRLFIPNNPSGDSLLETLIEMTGKIKIGPYTETPEPFMGPLINLHASNHLLTIEKGLETLGGKALLPLKEMMPGTPLLSPGIIDVTSLNTEIDEEHFGPLLQVIRTDTFDQAIVEANNTTYGLAAGIFTDNPQEYEKFYKLSRAGIINWNSQTTGASSKAPFGGVGKSGNFRPSALYAADYCNYPVASIEVDTLALPQTLTPGITL